MKLMLKMFFWGRFFYTLVLNGENSVPVGFQPRSTAEKHSNILYGKYKATISNRATLQWQDSRKALHTWKTTICWFYLVINSAD